MSTGQAVRGFAAGVTTSGTLAKGKHNPVDATSGSLTMTLPTGVTVGAIVSVEKADATANTVTVSGTIRGSASTLVLRLLNETVAFEAESSTSWRPIADHKTLTSLDGRYPGKAAIGYADVKTSGYTPGSNNGAGTTTLGQGSGVSFRMPMKKLSIAGTLLSMRVHITNQNDRLGTTPSPISALSFSGMWIGGVTRTSDGSGYTKDFAAAPVQVLSAFTADPSANGSEYVSAWVTDPNVLALMAADDYLLSAKYTVTGSSVVVQNEGMSFYAAGTVDPSAQVMTGTVITYVRHPLDIWVEYTFAGAGEVGFFVGDSQTDGYLGNVPQAKQAITSFAQQHAAMTKSSALVSANGGATAAEWATNLTSRRWLKWGIGTNIFPDFCFMMIGINDILAGTAATTIIGYIQTMITKVASLGIKRIYLGTVFPAAITAAQQQQLNILNEWISSVPQGVTGIFDISAAIRAPAVPGIKTTLSALTTAGATSITTPVTIPAGTAIAIDMPTGLIEYALTGTPTGSGPFTIPIANPSGGLANAHASGARVISTEAAIDYLITVDTLHLSALGNTRVAQALPGRFVAV